MLDREVQNRDAFAKALIDAIDLPAVVFDGETIVHLQNHAAIHLFGRFHDSAHLSARIRSPVILDLVSDVMESGQARSLEHSERLPAERWYEVRCAPLDFAAPGRSQALYVMTFRDQTEARRLDRMRSDFVANASHELRTPLTSLMGFVETMQGPARDDPAAQARFLPIMLDQATRMARLIDDLLSLSRLELRAHMPVTGSVDLKETVEHVIDTLKPTAAEFDVAIAFEAPAERVAVTGDRDELVQVFSNLVENACKYGQSGKRVEVSVLTGETGEAEVQVRDYGPGIPAEHVPRLTERFYRVDTGSSRAMKGTGLGLAIVKHILTRHKARLIIRSQVGDGSLFCVKFARL